MRKIILYIATSLDGYIADSTGDLEWLTAFSNPENSDYGYGDFYSGIQTLIMGRKTYQSVVDMNIPWPYTDKKTYVLSQREMAGVQTDVELLSQNYIEKVRELQREYGRDIWLVGGGEIASLFLKENLVDTMILTTIPTLLGSGIPLFTSVQNKSNWKVTNLTRHANGVVTTQYEKADF